MWAELMQAVLAGQWASAHRLLGAPMPAEWGHIGWEWLTGYIPQAERCPNEIGWGPRLLLLAAPDVGSAVVGEAGFHGPPDGDGQVEIGYMVVTAYRRRGFAAEAVTGLLGWAAQQHGISRVVAFVDPLNSPSIGLLRKLGFYQAGRRRHPERGMELVFRRDR